MAFLIVLGIVVVAAGLSRFVRQAEATAPLRQFLGSRSAVLAKLLDCPHCLAFWISLACTTALWKARGASPLEFGLFTLVGWRGAHYLNRGLDRRRQQTDRRPPLPQTCPVCGRPLGDEPVERRGAHYCSRDCWIDFLRTRPVPRGDLIGPQGELLRQDIYPSSYKDITCAEAQSLLAGDGHCVYLDVRSEPEFANGHPAGSYNVPLLHRDGIGMVPNPDFLTVLHVHFPRDTPLLVGCQSGVRSVRAIEALLASGYTDLCNVLGGFAGTRSLGGQSVDTGWLQQGLPVEYGESEERGYAALRGRR